MGTDLSVKMSLLRVQQLLFGYDRGHTLVAASSPSARKLSAEVLSDTDWDPRAKSSTSAYISGRALLRHKSYAMMKTWRAPEMPRPGCVWTHVLIIDNADLSRVSELNILAGYLQKPLKAGDYQDYSSEIEVDLSSSHLTDANLDQKIVKSLVGLIYKGDFDPALDNSSDAVEQELLALWSQQWPALRRRFSFRLASMTSNALSFNETFDVEFSRPSSPLMYNADLWESDTLLTIAEDITMGKPNGLRRFLWRYGADTDSRPVDLVRLSHLYQAISANMQVAPDLAAIIQKSSSWFPNRSNAGLFKSDLTRPTEAKYSLLPELDQIELAWAINSNGKEEAFPDLGPVDRKTVNQWTRDRPSELSELLGASLRDEGSFAKSLFDGITPKQHSDFLWGLLPDSEAVFLRAFGSSIENLADDRIKLLRDDCLVSLVENADDPALGAAKIVPYILSRENTEVISIINKHAGPTLTSAVIKSMANASNQSELSVGANWIECVREHPSQVIDFAKTNACKKSHLLTCRYLLNADTKPVPLSVWTERLEMMEDDLSGSIELDFKVFLLVQALKYPEMDSLTILRDTFDTIYDALAAHRMPIRTEMRIAEHLPHIGWFKNWDKCLRLKIVAVAICKSFEISEKKLLSISKHRRIKDDLNEIWNSWQLVRDK